MPQSRAVNVAAGLSRHPKWRRKAASTPPETAAITLPKSFFVDAAVGLAGSSLLHDNLMLSVPRELLRIPA